MAVGRKAQRNTTFGRLTNVTAEGGKAARNQNRRPGDNLVTGPGSEEDGVENRSEPQKWLADGDPGGTDSAQDVSPVAAVKTAPQPADEPGAADQKSDRRQPSPPPIPSSGNGKSWEQPLSGSQARQNGSSGSRPASNGGLPGSSGRSAQAPGLSPPLGVGGQGPSGSGAPPIPGRYGQSDATRGGTGTTTFAPPGKAKPRPLRPGKSPKPQRGPKPQSAAGQPPASAAASRRAQLAIARVEPWSVMKFSFMVSLVGYVILFVAVAVTYFVFQKIGVFTDIERTVGLVTSTKGRSGADAASWFSASRVLGYTMLVGAVNVILITALSTVGAVLYNLVTMMSGGIEVTLRETD
jgi:hypothetical protein